MKSPNDRHRSDNNGHVDHENDYVVGNGHGVDIDAVTRDVTVPAVVERRTLEDEGKHKGEAVGDADASQDVQCSPEPDELRGEDPSVQKNDGQLVEHDGEHECGSGEQEHLVMTHSGQHCCWQGMAAVES